MRPSTAVLIILLFGLICCAMAACVLGISAIVISDQTGEFDFVASPLIGQVAPDFNLKTIDGEDVALRDYRGKAVMVNFWAIWCDPCTKEMPIIEERYQRHYPDLVVLAIEEDGDSTRVGNFVAESGLSFLVLAGEDAVAQQYNIRAFPTSYFIDEHGVIQSMIVGSLSGPELDAELAKVGIEE